MRAKKQLFCKCGGLVKKYGKKRKVAYICDVCAAIVRTK